MTAALVERKPVITVEMKVKREKGWDVPRGFAAAS